MGGVADDAEKAIQIALHEAERKLLRHFEEG